MLSVNKSTVEVTAEFHPEGHRFLTRSYTKNGGHRRFKIDAVVSEMVQEHIEKDGIGPGQLIFPVRLFAKREASGKPRLSQDELDALGLTDPLPNGRRYSHGTMGAYITAKCRCRGCKQWSADYARDRKRARTGRVEGNGRRGGGETLRSTSGTDMWRRIWTRQSKMPGCPLPTLRIRSGIRTLPGSSTRGWTWSVCGTGSVTGITTTTRYVKILDEEDSTAADAIAAILGDVALKPSPTRWRS